MDRADIVHENFLRRQLDRTSCKLQARGEGFYTIGSSGHEGNAAIAAALRPTDMTFLHYRDAAFQIQRSRQVPGQIVHKEHGQASARVRAVVDHFVQHLQRNPALAPNG